MGSFSGWRHFPVRRLPEGAAEGRRRDGLLVLDRGSGWRNGSPLERDSRGWHQQVPLPLPPGAAEKEREKSQGERAQKGVPDRRQRHGEEQPGTTRRGGQGLQGTPPGEGAGRELPRRARLPFLQLVEPAADRRQLAPELETGGALRQVRRHRARFPPGGAAIMLPREELSHALAVHHSVPSSSST